MNFNFHRFTTHLLLNLLVFLLPLLLYFVRKQPPHRATQRESETMRNPFPLRAATHASCWSAIVLSLNESQTRRLRFASSCKPLYDIKTTTTEYVEY